MVILTKYNFCYLNLYIHKTEKGARKEQRERWDATVGYGRGWKAALKRRKDRLTEEHF